MKFGKAEKDKENSSKPKFSKYSTKEKAIIAALTSLTMSFVFLLFGPIDIYANNMREFAFSFSDIIGLVALSFVISFALLFGFLMLFNRYLLNMLSALAFSIIVASYFDNLCVKAVTVVSGDAKNASYGDLVLSFIIYVIIILAIVLVSGLLMNVWKKVVIYLSVLLIVMNGASLVTDFTKYNLFSDKGINTEYVLSQKNITKVSEKENIIYILFDRFDTTYYENVIKDDPSFFDDLDGFTIFDNATSMYTRTFPGVPYMISGVEYSLQCSPTEYFDEAYQTSPFLKDLKNNGYNVSVYADRYYVYSDASSFNGIADNVEKVEGYTPNKTDIFKYLTELSFARSFSMTLTSQMYENANTGRTNNLSKLNCENGIYANDDAKLYDLITENNLSDSGSDKNYTFLYLHGCHTPFVLDENCERTENATSLSQTKGSFKLVYEYLNQLKELGVYDNSTIIIAGDHGIPYTETEDLDAQVESGVKTCIMVKPRNTDAQGSSVSHAQVSAADIIPTIVKDAGLKTENSYGRGVFDIGENENVSRTFYQSVYSPAEHKLCFNKYSIEGDATDISNWKIAERIKSDYQWY